MVTEPQSSFEVIQSKIFEKSCVTCHSPGTSFQIQSDLDLSKDAAYDQLVNRRPHNEAALEDGLLLVGQEGIKSLFTSFLWEKINTPDFEHFYTDHPQYGELMPLAAPSLTNGELEYIREWIVAGAPKDGFVADEQLLADESRFEIPEGEFEPLDPPAQGIQLHLGPFDVASDFEREFFYYQPLDNSEELYVNKVEITMKAGSHHFILYDYPFGAEPEPETFRDLRDVNGNYIQSTVESMVLQRFVFGTQWRIMDYDFPTGVALEIPANWSLDLNSHYVNKASEEKDGEVYINLHTVNKSEVTKVAKNLFLNNLEIQLPAGKITTIKKPYIFSDNRSIFLLSSHAHQFMTEFKIYILGGERDGELVFYTQDWEHPPLLEFDPPLELSANQGLMAEATYNNTTARNLSFGFLSEDEMMIIFGAYYTE